MLSLFDVLCLGVNAIVGSGIYAFPGLLAAKLGPGSFLAFGLCGLMGALIGLCFVEAAGTFQRSGGPYVYARAAFGAWPGYLVGWTCWAAAVLSWAAVATLIPPYLKPLLPDLGAAWAWPAVTLALVASLGAINYLGVKPGAYTLDALTVAKLLPLLVLLVAGLRSLRRSLLTPLLPFGLGPLPRAAYTALFAFQGFEVVPVPAGETQNPRRNAPLALLGSLLLATLLYMAIQLAAVGSTPGLAGSDKPLAVMGRSLLGGAGGTLVAAAAVVSFLGFCSGVALAGPRYLEALCVDRHLPPALAARHPRFGTPHRAILATTLLTCALVAAFSFQRLVNLSVLMVGVQYLATCVAVPVLRRRLPDAERTFRLPGGALVPLLATGVTLWFGAQASATEAAWFGALLLLGVLLKLGSGATSWR
jgi:amino acid transporter